LYFVNIFVYLKGEVHKYVYLNGAVFSSKNNLFVHLKSINHQNSLNEFIDNTLADA